MCKCTSCRNLPNPPRIPSSTPSKPEVLPPTLPHFISIRDHSWIKTYRPHHFLSWNLIDNVTCEPWRFSLWKMFCQDFHHVIYWIMMLGWNFCDVPIMHEYIFPYPNIIHKMMSYEYYSYLSWQENIQQTDWDR